jgi:hypothetical protein
VSAGVVVVVVVVVAVVVVVVVVLETVGPAHRGFVAALQS